MEGIFQIRQLCQQVAMRRHGSGMRTQRKTKSLNYVVLHVYTQEIPIYLH